MFGRSRRADATTRVLDRDSHLVFRTVASKTIDTKAKPEKQQKNLQKAVAKMLKNYPPDQKK